MNTGPVNLLALDGGGIRGVSELLILDEIMSRLQHDLALTELPRPCEYFHLIGGTSTGGLVALMLGRLRMDTREALEQYNTVAGNIFSKKNKKWKTQDGTFKASTLEAEMKRVVARLAGDAELMMIDESLVDGLGRAVVLAMAASNMEFPRRFRSYGVRENRSINCRIWEVARATTAAPTFFKRISIAEPGQVAEDFLDAGIKCNNPVEEVIEEARLIFGDDRHVGCIVSLGTGHPGTIGLAKPDAFQRILPLKLIDTLKKIATNCEEVANRLSRKFVDCPDVYYRFNVTHGAGVVSLEEWEKMDEVVGHTKAYLQSAMVSKAIDSVVRVLLEQQRAGALAGLGTVTLGQICGSLPTLLPHMISSTKLIFSVPFEKDPNFVGRKDVLQEIDRRFETKRRVALCGIGGIGKSQIVVEYSYTWKERHPTGHVIWIHASTREKLEQAYRGIARELRLLGWEDPNIDTLNLAVRWLSKEDVNPWLLVLDNADDIEMFFGPVSRSQIDRPSSSFADLLPRHPQGSVLITTRDARVGQRLTDQEKAIEIAPLPPLDAEQLLQVKVAMDESTSASENHNLVATLGFIPLAITQAAAFIKENGMTVTAYTRDLEASDEDLQDYLDENLPDPRRDPTSENSVIRTWKLSFDQIAKQMPRAADLLSLIAVLDRQGIPEALLRQETDRRVEFNKALGTLLSFSLISVEKGGRDFEVHRLVHLSTQKWLALQGSQSMWQERALFLMAAKFPSGRHGTWQECETLYTHALKSLSCGSSAESTLLQRADLLENLAQYDRNQGRYGLASPRYEEVFRVRGTVLGKDHPSTLTSMNNLASVLDSQGKYDAAEEMHRQTLRLYETVLGKDHPSTLTSMNNLALVLDSQGKYDAAEEMHRQTLQLRQTVLGKDHPSTLTSMNNLASVLKSQGKYDAAEEIHRQTLQLRQTVLGKDHPSTLTSMNNLASVLKSQGKYDAAEEMHRQELQLCETVLGKDHPDTLTSMNNLASVLKSQGKYDASEEIHRQTLQLRQTVLGKDHPDTLSSMNNLALVLNNQGKYYAAEEMHRQTLRLCETVLGKDHPSTLTSMNNLALVLDSQGKYYAAEEIHRQTLRLYETILGKDHPSTLTSMNNLASVLNSQGKYDAAEEMHRQTLQLCETVLGKDHPDTLSSLFNLASTLVMLGDLPAAEILFQLGLERCEAVYGAEHSETIESRRNLASLLEKQGKIVDGEML